MTNVGTVDYQTDARGQTLPPVLPAHAPPLQLHNGRENVQEDRSLVSPPVVSVGSGSDGSHFGFIADQGGIAGTSVHGMMVLNQPVYVSSVGGSSVPLGMAVNVQSEGMASNSQTGSSSQEEVSSPSSPASTDDLRNVLRQQLEYYFSKDNLATDKYLLSQMDGDHYVPVSVIASFNQVKKLTADMDQVVEAIRGSGVLQLDETGSKVRAVPEKRCILILREIPKETAHESIMELFQGKSCPRILGCQFAENDCWYVTFGSEEEAQEAHRYLREEVREFLGNPIRARIKNTAITRPSSVPKPRPQFPYPTAVQVYNGQTVPFYPQQSGVVGWSPYYNSPYNTPTSSSYTAPPLSGGRFPSHGSASGGNVGGGAGGRGRNVGGRGHHRHMDGLVAGGSGRLPSNNSSTGGGSHYGPTGAGGGGGGRYGRRDSEERNRNLPNRLKKQRSEDSGRQRSQNRTPQKLDFALNNFPPLPGSDGTQACPPPAPPPPALPDEGASNLADIVKGRKNKDGSSIPEKSASAPTTPTCVSLVTSSNGTSGNSSSSNNAIPVSKTSSTPVQPIPPVTPPQSPVPPPSPPPPVSLPPAATGPTTVAVVNQSHKPQRVVDKAYQKDKAISSKVGSAAYASGYQPGTGIHHTSSPSNSKQAVDKEAIVKHTVPPRNSQIPPRAPPPAPRNRHREKEVRRAPTGMAVAAQRPSPKPCKKPAPPPPPTNASAPSGDKPSKTEEVKPEKLSYAQMAGQKPKPSPTQKPVASNGNGASQKASQSSPLQPQALAAGGESSDPSSPTAAASLATPTNPAQHIAAGAEENASFETSPSSTATQEAQSP